MLEEENMRFLRRLGEVKGLRSLTWFSAAYPAAMVLLVLLAWSLSFVQLGHPPRYWVDDPFQISGLVSLVVGSFYVLALLWLGAALVSAGFWSIGLVSRVLQTELRFWPVVIPPVFWAAFIGLVYWDPGAVLKWLFD
jgi:hypothetical protein